MQKRRLGYSHLHLTTVGLGAWAIGGPWQFGWGKQDDQDSIDTILRALDLGINWIDTAAVYGLGHSEKIVGQALKGRRDDVIVATKCGRVWDDPNQGVFSRIKSPSIRKEAEDSLRRLQIDVIDLYQIHWGAPDEDIEEGWTEMARLVEEGKVRYIGVSNFTVGQMERARTIHPIASLQPPYSLLRRDVEAELLPYCAEHGIGVIVYSPMQAGLLTGKLTKESIQALPADDWRHGSRQFQEPELDVNLRFTDGLKALASRLGCTAAQLSIAWVLRRRELTSAIVGARRPGQIEETAPAGDLVLTDEDLGEIEGLLSEREAALRLL